MAAIITEKFRQTNATAFYDNVGAANGKYYMFIGKSQPWTSEGATTDNNPPAPLDNVAEEPCYWDDMLGAKLISSKSYVIPRRDYSTGVAFDMYRHDVGAVTSGNYNTTKTTTSSGATSLYDSTFYFKTAEHKVYKVLYNGDEAQTGANNISGTAPTSVTSTPFWHDANYYLKYMYTMSASQVQNYLTTDFMPISTNDNTAANRGIFVFIVTDPGTNGTRPDGTYYTKVRGDGSGAIIKLVVSGDGSITAFAETGASAMQANGTGYTFASVDLSVTNIFTNTAATTPISGQDATDWTTALNANPPKIKVIVDPPEGHGKNDLEELGGHYVMLQAKFEPADSDVVQVNDFRRVGIVKNPINPLTSQISVLSSARTTGAIRITANVAFQVDEEIFQAGSHARARVVEYDSTNKIIYYIQEKYSTYGLSTDNSVKNNIVAFNTTGQITGVTSSVNGTVDTNADSTINGVSFTDGLSGPELNRDSGDIIYVENRRAISRASDQTEDIKVVVEF